MKQINIKNSNNCFGKFINSFQQLNLKNIFEKL